VPPSQADSKQAELAQRCPAAHALEHEPQWASSVSSRAQSAPQGTVPTGHCVTAGDGEVH
jgi:hypothetical protein